MAKVFRVTPLFRLANWFARLMVRAGVPIGRISLLTVVGRKSGQPRTTPVAVMTFDGQRYLVASGGVGDWVRNLRAAERATLTRGRRSETIRAVELAPEAAALILQHTLQAAPGMVRPYFETTAESSLQELAREAERHPVFQLHGSH